MKQLIHYILLLIFSIFILVGCNKTTSVTTSKVIEPVVVLPKFIQQYPNFDKQTLVSSLEEYLQIDSTLYTLYSSNDFTPIWTDDTLNMNKINSLIALLDNIDYHGLPDNFFRKDEISSLAISIDSGIVPDSLLYKKLVALDHIATKTVVDYVTGMHFGFLRPDTLFKKDHNIKILRPDSTFFKQAYTDINYDAITTMILSQPIDSTYLRMQEAYKYWKEREEVKFKQIKGKGKNLAYKLDDKSPNISNIADRMIQTGEYVPDTTSTDTLHQILNKELLTAVNTFRKQNSYPEENEIGALTVDALNRNTNYYIKTLRANMERYRWTRAKPREEKHIEVNVAAFKLFATQADSISLIMRVCVGSVKHKTPLLESNLGYINLNPLWNIPKSIARNEVFIAQAKDDTYLQKRNMRVFKGGVEIDPTIIDWANAKQSELNTYFVRQDPGDGNSLGRLKFMFNNSFSVYLHDTPSKRAFTRKNRAVSHGCVRLQQPVDLAFFCTSPATDLYKDQLRHAINIAPQSAEGKKLLKNELLTPIKDIINMKEKISLCLDYYTVYMQPKDTTLYYADDVYQYDKIILDALANQVN